MGTKVIVLKPEDEHLLAEYGRAQAAYLQATKAVEDYRAAHNGDFHEGLLELMSKAMHAEIAAIQAIRDKG